MGKKSKRLAALGMGSDDDDMTDDTDVDALEESDEDEGDDTAKADAGEALASALKTGDGKAIARAFADMMAVCEEY